MKEQCYQDESQQAYSFQTAEEGDVYAFSTYKEVKENIACVFFSEYENSEEDPFVKYIYPEQKSLLNNELK
jgi:hypothetical protein